jgi:hypothetical protein|nr:MAG TPA: hypothetical protein [Caudoviricetes sp.]
MLKKLYFHLSDERIYVFNIKRTIRVDEEDFTKWIVSINPQNELGVSEVVVTTDDCMIDTIGGESLVAIKINPPENEQTIPLETEKTIPLETEKTETDPDKWTINVESNADYIENWSVRGKIRWTEDGGLEILKDDGYRVRLSGYIRKFDVDDEKQVITVRYKN